MKYLVQTALGFAFVVLSVGCNKKKEGEVGGAAQKVEKLTPQPQLATQLGFASRVPGDADAFLAGYHVDALIKSIAEIMKGDFEQTEEKKKEFDDVVKQLGSEHFLFLGSGVGRQLGQAITTQKEVSAALIGYVAGAMLDHARDGNFSPEAPDLEELFPKEMTDGWMDAILHDKHLIVPSVVVGWRPNAEQEAESLALCRKFVVNIFKEVTEAEKVEFDAYGGFFSGYVIKGDVAFKEMLDTSGEVLQEHADTVKALSVLDEERMVKLRTAMEKMELTVASGVVDGRVLVYLGNGKSGFRLAEKPEDSLAAADKLGWTNAMADRPQPAVMYLSESMLGAMRSLLDNSSLWNRLAEAVRAPIRDERTIRKLLEQMAESSRRLAKRDAKAFSMVFLNDNGYRWEARGGWLDPGLDYDRPLCMEAATTAGNPVFRAHWVKNRVRKDAELDQMELLGMILEALVVDVTNQYAEKEGDTENLRGHVRRLIDEVRTFSRMYRDEFRAGLGDEVVVMADVRGEIPPIPGISEQMIREFTAPRMLVAVPVVNRSLVEKSGKSLYGQWKGLTAFASESADFHLPLIAPQLIESGGISTWYPPAPFIGGDFVPGVSMNDKLWMISSSRSMVADFARGFASTSKSGETGVVAELDIAPLRDWLTKVYRYGNLDAQESLDHSLGLFTFKPEGMDVVNAWHRRMETVRYRHWKEDDCARWSLHLKMADPIR